MRGTREEEEEEDMEYIIYAIRGKSGPSDTLCNVSGPGALVGRKGLPDLSRQSRLLPLSLISS